MITDKNSIIKIKTETDVSAIVTVDSESRITKAARCENAVFIRLFGGNFDRRRS